MRLAVLMANTDDTEFSRRHPPDDEAFADFILKRRREWRCEVLPIKDHVFPTCILDYDGYVITGSVESVINGNSWTPRLLSEIRRIVSAGIPLFGACYGHQAIALALGGEVRVNPDGWCLGRVRAGVRHGCNWDGEGEEELCLYAAHSEQVTRLPPGSRVVLSATACPLGGMELGSKVFSTQYHPEMTPAFMTDLLRHMSQEVPRPVIKSAWQSMSLEDQSDRLRDWIVQFFEQAGQR